MAAMAPAQPPACFRRDGLCSTPRPPAGRAGRAAPLGCKLSTRRSLLGLRGVGAWTTPRQVNRPGIEAEGVKPPDTEELRRATPPIARHLLLDGKKPMERGSRVTGPRPGPGRSRWALSTSSRSSSVALKNARPPLAGAAGNPVSTAMIPTWAAARARPGRFPVSGPAPGPTHKTAGLRDSQAGTAGALAAGCRVMFCCRPGVGQENYPAAAHCLLRFPTRSLAFEPVMALKRASNHEPAPESRPSRPRTVVRVPSWFARFHRTPA